MAQDPSLDNLHHAPGTATTALGTLGRVRKAGAGPRTLVLIPGLGFGDGIWAEFMERQQKAYTMYAVTLPGFGDTAPWPVPSDGASFSERPWMTAAVRGIERLLDEEHIGRVTLVAHWAFATQVALRLALDHPDRVESVVLVGGVLKSYFDSTPAMMTWTAEQRTKFADGMGQKWFATVTRTTWDDNNFMPYDYAVHPLRGLFLWRQAQAPPLPVWIRYLLEFYSLDLSSELPRLRVPTLVMQPGFDDGGFYVDQGRDYMRNFCVDSWRGATETNAKIEVVTVPKSRLFVMFDRSEEFDGLVERFLQRIAK
jgi:pimeloyl-ACP methyl ester carboxylesterase